MLDRNAARARTVHVTDQAERLAAHGVLGQPGDWGLRPPGAGRPHDRPGRPGELLTGQHRPETLMVQACRRQHGGEGPVPGDLGSAGPQRVTEPGLGDLGPDPRRPVPEHSGQHVRHARRLVLLALVGGIVGPLGKRGEGRRSSPTAPGRSWSARPRSGPGRPARGPGPRPRPRWLRRRCGLPAAGSIRKMCAMVSPQPTCRMLVACHSSTCWRPASSVGTRCTHRPRAQAGVGQPGVVPVLVLDHVVRPIAPLLAVDRVRLRLDRWRLHRLGRRSGLALHRAPGLHVRLAGRGLLRAGRLLPGSLGSHGVRPITARTPTRPAPAGSS